MDRRTVNTALRNAQYDLKLDRLGIRDIISNEHWSATTN